MRTLLFSLTLLFGTLVSCNSRNAAGKSANEDLSHAGPVSEILVEYGFPGQPFRSMAAYIADKKDKKPIVLVVPEWWGVNNYIKNRVRQLAALGYFAMAVDMYGAGKVTERPDSAAAWAPEFYKDPEMARAHFEAALAKAKSFNQADSTKVAAIGYCFGGGMVLNMARLGIDLDGVASFHGSLDGFLPPVQKGIVKPALLVLNGAADSFVKPEEVAKFKAEMDQAGVTYKFIDYPDAKHAFTNPEATAIGVTHQLDIAYNEAADKASWKELTTFLKEVFQ